MIDLAIMMFVVLFVKHFVVDFPLQTSYQYLNKGTYGHNGGILHGALHVIGTLVALTLVLGLQRFDLIVVLAIVEGIVHYHIDWAKMNINRKMNWKCNTSEHFWLMTGLDQFLHYMTYAAMVLVYFRLA